MLVPLGGTHYIRCIWGWSLRVPSQGYHHFPNDFNKASTHPWWILWINIKVLQVQFLVTSSFWREVLIFNMLSTWNSLNSELHHIPTFPSFKVNNSLIYPSKWRLESITGTVTQRWPSPWVAFQLQFQSYCWWFRNPANQLRLVVYLIIHEVFYIPGGAGFLPSTVSHVAFFFSSRSWPKKAIWYKIPTHAKHASHPRSCRRKEPQLHQRGSHDK